MTKNLSHTKIEYGDYNWAIAYGCLNKPQGICPVPHCWAEGMAKRFPAIYGDFHKPHIIPENLLAPLSLKKPSTILVNFMGDLGGDWVDPEYPINEGTGLEADRYIGMSLCEYVVDVMNQCPQHRFLFLTKRPENWRKWNPWPENAWVGATVCNQKMAHVAIDSLRSVEANHKCLSIEPLMEHVMIPQAQLILSGIEWVVIGGMDNGKNPPGMTDSIREIVEACDKAGVKVFIKGNLNSEHLPQNAFRQGLVRKEVPWTDKEV